MSWLLSLALLLLLLLFEPARGLGQFQQLADLFVDGANGTDINNNGTDRNQPLRSLAAAAAQFALGVGLQPGDFASQTIYVRAGVYSGPSNCHVMMGTGTGASPGRAQLIAYDAHFNNTHAIFRCGSLVFSATEAFVHFFALAEVNVTRFAYHDTFIDANAVTTGGAPLATCKTASFTMRFGQCPAFVLGAGPDVSPFTKHPGVVLDNVQVVNVTMNRTEPFDISLMLNPPSQTPLVLLYGFSQHVADPVAIIVRDFLAANNTVHISSCTTRAVNESLGAMHAWSVFSGATLAASGVVALDNSMFTDNTLHVYRNGDNCYYGGGAALLLQDALPLPNKSLIVNSAFVRNGVLAYDNARAAGAAVAYATNELFAFTNSINMAIDSTFAGNFINSDGVKMVSGAAVAVAMHTLELALMQSRSSLAQRSSSPLPLRASFSSCFFMHNYAKSKGMCMGGALLVGGRVEAVASQFINNSLTCHQATGGALSAMDFNLTNSLFQSNAVVYNPMSVVRFDSNRAGGAVAPIVLNDCLVNGSHPRIVNSTFDSNDAAVGGAIYMPLNQCASIVLLINSTFSGNRAAYGSVYYGAGNTGVDMDGVTVVNSVAYRAATMYLELTAMFHCAHSVWDNNTAPVGAAVVASSVIVVMFENSTVSNNVGDRGAVLRLADVAYKAHMFNVVFRNNVAKRANGGALEIVNALTIGNVSVIGCLFESNQAAYGGAMYVSGYGRLNVTRVEYRNNKALAGGAMGIVGANVTLVDTKVLANIAIGDGGGMTVEGGAYIDMRDSAFDSNKASGNGGVMSLRDSTAVMGNCTFATNTAETTGGCVYASGLSKLIVSNSSVYGGITRTGGFLQAVDTTSVYMFDVLAQYQQVSGVEVPKNPSTTVIVHGEDTVAFGGGVLSLEGAVQAVVNQSSFNFNILDRGVGGVVRCIGCNLVMHDCEMLNNSVGVSLGGGAVFVQSNASTLDFRDVRVMYNNVSRTRYQYALDHFASGGAFVFRVPSLTTDASLVRVLAVGNVADRGGAIYLSDSDASSFGHRMFNCSELELHDNTALLVGGGVFFQVDEQAISGVLGTCINATNNRASCYGSDIGTDPTQLKVVGALPRTAMRSVPLNISLESLDAYGRLTRCPARGGARVIMAHVLNGSCALASNSLCMVPDEIGGCVGSLVVTDGTINDTCAIRIDLHSSDVLSPVVAWFDFLLTVVQCGPGYGIDRGDCHECPEGTYTITSGSACHACPPMATCFHGASVSAKAGAFLVENDDGTIDSYQCESHACLAAPPGTLNSCGGGRDGLLCATCAGSNETHYIAPTSQRPNGSMCLPCDEPTYWLLALLCAAGFALCLYLHHSVQGASSRLKILFYFTQATTQVLPHGAVSQLFSIISLRAERGSPVLLDYCLLPVGPLSMQLVQMAVPGALVTSLLIIYGLQRLYLLCRAAMAPAPHMVVLDRGADDNDGDDVSRNVVVGGSGGIVDGEDDDNADDERQPLSINDSINKGSNGSIGLDEVRSGGELPSSTSSSTVVSSSLDFVQSTAMPPSGHIGDRSFFSTDRLVRTLIFFLLLSFSTLLQTTMSVLWCFDVGTERVLVAEPSEQCSGDRYGRARAAALFVMLPLIVAMPLALAALLLVWYRKGRLIVSRSAERVADIDVRYGVLYENYKHKAFLWEVFNLLRRVAMAMVTIFLSNTPYFALAMTLLCFVVLASTWTVRPFVNEVENRLEIFSLSMLLIFSILSQAVEASVLPESFFTVLGIVALVCASIMALSAVIRRRTAVWQLAKRVWRWLKAWQSGGGVSKPAKRQR